MKKYLSILVAVMLAALSFTLTSCGDDDDGEDDPGQSGTSALLVNSKKVAVNGYRTNCSITLLDSREYEGYYLFFLGCGFNCHFTYNDIDYTLAVTSDAYSGKTQDEDRDAFRSECWKQARTYQWVKVGDVLDIDHIHLYETDRIGAGMRVFHHTGQIVIVGKTKDSITLEFKDFSIPDSDAEIDMYGDDEFKFNGKVTYTINELGD